MTDTGSNELTNNSPTPPLLPPNPPSLDAPKLTFQTDKDTLHRLVHMTHAHQMSIPEFLTRLITEAYLNHLTINPDEPLPERTDPNATETT